MNFLCNKPYSWIGLFILTVVCMPMVVQAQSLSVIFDGSGTGAITVAEEATVTGKVQLAGHGPYANYHIGLLSSGALSAASTGPGAHILDAAAVDASSASQKKIDRLLLQLAGLTNTADPTTLFTFSIKLAAGVQGTVDLTFIMNEGLVVDYAVSIGATDQSRAIEAFTLSPGVITVGAVVDTPTDTPPPPDTPTDTPEPPTPTNTESVPETTFTPTEAPPDTPTNTPEPTNTETTFTPTDTPEPTETPIPEDLLVSIDGFGGVHGTTINRGAFSPMGDPYFWPMNIMRDANITADGRGILLLEATSHVYVVSLGENSLPQIPNIDQYYYLNQDVAVAVRPAGEAADAAYVLIDDGKILPVGNAEDIADIFPPLPFRDGTLEDYDGDPENRQIEIPGPLQGPLNIGTVAETGGWNPDSAIDLAVVEGSSALVLARNGLIYKTGPVQPELEIRPYFGVDIARRIEFVPVDGPDYCVILDGLGGVHLAGPASSTLRDNWNANVLSTLAYFGAVIGQVNGHDVFAGLDAANDLVLVPNGDDNLGVIMLDGYGGLHKANVPSKYQGVELPYFGSHPEANLHWVVSLMGLE